MAGKKKKREKHIPMRTCVACRTQQPKMGLVRVVRKPDAQIVVDGPRGKTSGRGAYLCPTPDCMQLALKKKALQHVLKTQIASDQLDTIKDDFIQRLMELETETKLSDAK